MSFIERVHYVLNAEAEAILNLPIKEIDTKLPLLAQMLLECKGKVVTTGVGKNGFIAERVAATLSCTGTSAFFLPPANGLHGDIGMLSGGDILLALSNSGKTREILEVVAQIKQYFSDVKIVVVTGDKDSPLAHLADLTIAYGIIEEPCPLGFVPSASLAVMSAILDALALGIMEMRGFTREDLLIRHHAGYIGRQLQTIQKDQSENDNWLMNFVATNVG